MHLSSSSVAFSPPRRRTLIASSLQHTVHLFLISRIINPVNGHNFQVNDLVVLRHCRQLRVVKLILYSGNRDTQTTGLIREQGL